jgi:hypothetical protein
MSEARRAYKHKEPKKALRAREHGSQHEHGEAAGEDERRVRAHRGSVSSPRVGAAASREHGEPCCAQPRRGGRPDPRKPDGRAPGGVGRRHAEPAKAAGGLGAPPGPAAHVEDASRRADGLDRFDRDQRAAAEPAAHSKCHRVQRIAIEVNPLDLSEPSASA